MLTVKHSVCWQSMIKMVKNPVMTFEEEVRLHMKVYARRLGYTVRVKKKIPKRLGIFRPNFTYLIYVSIYAGLQIFIQLSAILMKLCHIKCDHPVHIINSKCPPSAKMHAGIFWYFLQTCGNFWSKFYMPTIRSYIR